MSSYVGLVMVFTHDMPATKAFYTELLGFEIIKEFSSPADDFLFLHSQTSTTNIALQDANQQSYGIPKEYDGIIPSFVVEDADAVYQEWKAKSIEILSEVIDIGVGHMFTAKDPAGNYIQVYHLYPQVRAMHKQMGLS